MTKQNIDIFYSLPEVWDFCLKKLYSKREYLAGFEQVMKKLGIKKKSSLILDAGCGSGFPAVDLIKRGYRVIGIDKSSEMVRQTKINAEKQRLSIQAYNTMWSELDKEFDQIFDFVYCRGNSLIYAASWEQNWIVPKRSHEEIVKAIKNFYQALKPNGKLYIDITKRDERPYKKPIGIVQTVHGPVEITWEMGHDRKNAIRTWISHLRFLKLHTIRSYASHSYLLPHDELIKIFRATGFKKIDRYVSVRGEKNYDVFIAYK